MMSAAGRGPSVRQRRRRRRGRVVVGGNPERTAESITMKRCVSVEKKRNAKNLGLLRRTEASRLGVRRRLFWNNRHARSTVVNRVKGRESSNRRLSPELLRLAVRFCRFLVTARTFSSDALTSQPILIAEKTFSQTAAISSGSIDELIHVTRKRAQELQKRSKMAGINKHILEV